MQEVINRFPMITNQITVFITGLFGSILSWFSFHGSNLNIAVIDLALTNSFIEQTQPLISYLGTLIGLLASCVALILGCWNLKKRITRAFNRKRRQTDS